MSAQGTPPGAAPEPHLRVVRGAADELDLAALVAGLVAVGGPHGHEHSVQASTAPASAWCDRRRTVRGQVPPAPGADVWRWSQR